MEGPWNASKMASEASVTARGSMPPAEQVAVVFVDPHVKLDEVPVTKQIYKNVKMKITCCDYNIMQLTRLPTTLV